MRCLVFFFPPSNLFKFVKPAKVEKKKGPPNQAEIMLKSPTASFVIKRNRHFMLSDSTVKTLV